MEPRSLDVESQCGVGQDEPSHSPIISTSEMAKSAHLRPIDHKKGIARRPQKQTLRPKYAPEPTLEEYRQFPPGFRLENGSWPAEEILEISGANGPERKRSYLIQWHPHPLTRQYFEPTWVSLLSFYVELHN